MRYVEYLNVAWLCLSTVALVALQLKPWGFALLAAGAASLYFTSPEFRRNIALVYGAVAILGITPINTSTDWPHAPIMGLAMAAVVLGPYLITKYLYKNGVVRFPFGAGREWKRKELFYVLFTVIAGYLILPPMLRFDSIYQNWTIEPGFFNILESYVGLNVVGVWDELFFVSTVLALFRKHLSFWAANLAQSTIFTSFLYTLGFQGFSPLIIFPFALTQGYIFKKTDSLLYVLTIHLTLDLVLHLTLVYLHHPTWIPIFVT